MIRSVIPFLVLALSALSSAQAAIVTMDFEGVVPDGASIDPVPGIYEEEGMRLTHNSSGLGGIAVFSQGANVNGAGTLTYDSAVLGWCNISTFSCQNDYVVLTQISGQAFDLISLDAGRLSYVEGIGPITLIGTLAGGGVVSTQLSIVEDVLTTFSFGSEWQGLISLELAGSANIGDYDVALDNVVVNAVPIPAAAWLFGSALAGLGWLRRKPATEAAV